MIVKNVETNKIVLSVILDDDEQDTYSMIRIRHFDETKIPQIIDIYKEKKNSLTPHQVCLLWIELVSESISAKTEVVSIGKPGFDEILMWTN
jgi:hypothetical protein